MAEAVTFEHDGIVYEVQDFRYEGTGEKRVKLNSLNADGRKFIPRDPAFPTRIYHFKRINYGKSDDATNAQLFKFSHPVRR